MNLSESIKQLEETPPTDLSDIPSGPFRSFILFVLAYCRTFLGSPKLNVTKSSIEIEATHPNGVKLTFLLSKLSKKVLLALVLNQDSPNEVSESLLVNFDQITSENHISDTSINVLLEKIANLMRKLQLPNPSAPTPTQEPRTGPNNQQQEPRDPALSSAMPRFPADVSAPPQPAPGSRPSPLDPPGFEDDYQMLPHSQPAVPQPYNPLAIGESDRNPFPGHPELGPMLDPYGIPSEQRGMIPGPDHPIFHRPAPRSGDGTELGRVPGARFDDPMPRPSRRWPGGNDYT